MLQPHLLLLPHPVPRLLLLPRPGPRRLLNALAGTHLLNVQAERQHSAVTRLPLLNALVGTHLPNVQAAASHKRSALAEALLLRHQQEEEHAPHPRIAQVGTGSSGKGRLPISSALALLEVHLPSKDHLGPRIAVVVRGQWQRALERRDAHRVEHSEEGVLALLPIDHRSDVYPSSRRNQQDQSQSRHRLW